MMFDTNFGENYNLYLESQIKLGKCFIANNSPLDNKTFNKFELLNFIYNDNEKIKNFKIGVVIDTSDNIIKGWFRCSKEEQIKYFLQILKQLENNRHLLKQLNKKWTFEELIEEAFKPSRVNYILSLDPDYEF